jgi:acyl-CoA hydrolase/RimJ/RimL family protein N-acetyltransferase
MIWTHSISEVAMQGYDPQSYARKLRTAEEAISAIRSGQRIFVGSSCGEPQHLVNTLLLNKHRFSDLEIMRFLSLEGAITAMYGDPASGRTFAVRGIYQGAGFSDSLAGTRRFLTPMSISLIPALFKSRQLPIHFALIQVSPPDEFGWMSLGISVDITKAAAQAADHVIAQVNPGMPRVLGNSFIHVNEIDAIVEREEEVLTILEFPEPEAMESIVSLVAHLVEDGSIFQLGLGEATASIIKALSRKNDLGVHTLCMTDGIMELMQKGVINNRYKEINEGKVVASTAIGTTALYQFMQNNPAIELHPADYVCNPGIIAAHKRMVAINTATAIDLTGQVAADALPQNHYSGVTGMTEFVQGATHSLGGKSIIIIPSITAGGKRSRIVPELAIGTVVLPKIDVHYVVTEYGAVNLFGKNLQERAMAIISIAHPDHRHELFEKAKDIGLIEKERSLTESLFGIYPVYLEEIREYDGVKVMFRPEKTGDIRHIQEHFYNLDVNDVATRFFQQRTTFYKDQIESMYDVNYIKNMTIVAVTGEEGTFEKVIGLGEYIVEGAKDTAEVAFSVSKAWQGKGIAGVILKKVAEAARENGLGGLVAYTSPNNTSMIKLFKKLPYKITTSLEDDFFVLRCRFDEPESVV